MKNLKRNSTSATINNSAYGYFNNYKISFEDYERIRYPNSDIKRSVIEKMLADKINELYMILDEIKQK